MKEKSHPKCLIMLKINTSEMSGWKWKDLWSLTEPTLVLLGGVVVVDLLSDAFAFPQVASQVFLLLLVVMAEEFLPVVWIDVLLLFDDFSLHLLLERHKKVKWWLSTSFVEAVCPFSAAVETWFLRRHETWCEYKDWKIYCYGDMKI